MTKKVMLLFITVSMLLSCSKEKTLQQYYIDKQDSDNFMLIDVPSSIISIKEDAPKDVKETLESVKKLNLMVFKVDENNKTEYLKEKEEIKKILKSQHYQDLVRMNHKGAHVIAKYTGDVNAVDEMILFVSDDHKGFAVARLIGDDIKPQNILKLLQNIDQVDEDSPVFSQIKSMAGEMK